MRETRLDLNQFHDIINTTIGNTLIWAPRQSGKTFALIRKFVEIRNSILLYTHHQMATIIRDYSTTLGYPDRYRDLYPISSNNIIGRRASYAFIDEIDAYNGDIRYILELLYSTSGRIISISTPHWRSSGAYPGIFQNECTLTSDNLIHWNKQKTLNYFDKEGDLFEI